VGRRTVRITWIAPGHGQSWGSGDSDTPRGPNGRWRVIVKMVSNMMAVDTCHSSLHAERPCYGDGLETDNAIGVFLSLNVRQVFKLPAEPHRSGF
jgi:hypothetical protein